MPSIVVRSRVYRVALKISVSSDILCNELFLSICFDSIDKIFEHSILYIRTSVYSIYKLSLHRSCCYFSPFETANAIVLTSIAPCFAVQFIILPYPSVRFAVAIRNGNLSNVSHNWAIIAPVIIKYEARFRHSQEIGISSRDQICALHVRGTFVERIRLVHPDIRVRCLFTAGGLFYGA